MKKRSLKLLSVAGFIAGLAMIFASCGKDNVPELIVEDPVITVSEADENGRVSVTLSCKTADAQIFYSTDGADPSTEYSAPITLTPGAEEKTYTVKAQAKKSGYTASKVVQESVTVAAAEEDIATFTVTFDSDGGTAVDPVTAEDGTPISEPTAPTKTGYTFAGWYNGETKYDFISNVTSDLTLTAKWTINKYTVTFDTDGGSAIESVTVDYNTAAAQPATNPTKTGYTFAGWKVGETTYDFATLVTADTTVKAVWTINTYTITFDSDGGSAVESITVDYNTTATQPEEPTKDGEYFAGWVDAEGNAFQFTTPITADITLKATWTTDPVYTVTIDPNYEGASTTSIYATKDTEYKVTLSAPSRTGYTFSGWTTDAEGTTAADFTVAISNNTTTFYAQWETATFTVTFDVDGTTTPVTVNYGETIAASDIPSTTKANYTFTGWKNGETAFDVTTAITSSVTLKATWEIYKYTVTLDNDGTTSKLAENVAHGTAVAAPTTTPTKTGYTFAGWKLGDADYNFATPVTADITLTAAWTINSYNVTFNTDGGSAVEATTVNYNTTVSKPEDPTKDGYVFRGWVCGETTYNFSTPVTSDITLTAVWYAPQTYTYTIERDSIFITKNNDAEVDNEYQAKITNVIPDTDRFEVGDKVSITLKGYSKSSIDELGISIVDNTAAADYWLVLAEPDNIGIVENTQFTETVELTVKAKAIGTGAASQTIVLTYNGDAGAVIYKDEATMSALTPKSYTYTIPATATEPIEFIADSDSENVDDDYKAVLTNTIPTLKAGDTVTLKISGASTIDIANLSAMIFDNTEEAGLYKVLSSTENFSEITAKTDFSELSVTLSITDDPVGTGANSQKIMLKYNGSGAAKIYDNAENIPELPPIDDPTGDDDVLLNTVKNADWDNVLAGIGADRYANVTDDTMFIMQVSKDTNRLVTQKEDGSDDYSQCYTLIQLMDFSPNGTKFTAGTVTGGTMTSGNQIEGMFQDSDTNTRFYTVTYKPTAEEWAKIKTTGIGIQAHGVMFKEIKLGTISEPIYSGIWTGSAELDWSKGDNNGDVIAKDSFKASAKGIRLTFTTGENEGTLKIMSQRDWSDRTVSTVSGEGYLITDGDDANKAVKFNSNKTEATITLEFTSEIMTEFSENGIKFFGDAATISKIELVE